MQESSKQPFLIRSSKSRQSEFNAVKAGDNLRRLSFSVLRLQAGETLDLSTPAGHEGVCILIQGDVFISFGAATRKFTRRNPFVDEPGGLFLNSASKFSLRGTDPQGSLLVFGHAVIDGTPENCGSVIWIDPEEIKAFPRGRAAYSRTIRDIIDSRFAARSILCGETFHPGGHWSSYPPHKHDTSSAKESVHEEVYFYFFDKPEGWGYQEIYSPEQSQSEVLRVETGDVVRIPFGYHPVTAAPGYQLYYFWILAGSDRNLRMNDDPRHAWIKTAPKPVRPLRQTLSPLPTVAESSVLKALNDYEAASMQGQPPVIWDRASGYQVFDERGNVYLDFTSGVLVANCGHNHPQVQEAIRRELDRGLLTSYLFPNRARAELVEKLASIAPEGLSGVALFCSGSEAIECSIKLARTWGLRTSAKKRILVSFERSFHGRTMGAQLAGGIPELKNWIDHSSAASDFVQVPFPDGFFQGDLSFELFERSLSDLGISSADVCGVLAESYQGGVVSFAPVEYMQKLRKWCDAHGALMIMDEVQAGFGRTGRWWGFEHYGIQPDLIACGKGISSSLPLSAVIGRKDILDQYPPGSMSTTHSGNPLACAAALASIKVLQDEKLAARAQSFERIITEELSGLPAGLNQKLKGVFGKGLVFALHFADGETARRIVWNCVEQGLLLFAPVGPGEKTIKVNPPLIIDEEALRDGLQVLKTAIQTCR